MSHPELIFPLDEAHEALAMMGPDGLLHHEPVESGHETNDAPRHYSISPLLEAWAHTRMQ